MPDLLDFTPPSPQNAQRAYNLLAQWFSPTFSGLQHLDAARPALYVGNHTLLGFDVAPMVLGSYLERGIWLRGVGDRVHFRLPLWGRMVQQFGAFNGTRQSISQLMQHREHILIYPGGGREVMKNKGEAYQLIWKNRVGFIELALQHGYDIIPFAARGGEELFDLKYDSTDFKKSTLGKWAAKAHLLRYMRDGEAFLPLATGLAGLPFVPRRAALHYQFMPRIETRHLPPECHNDIKWKLRDKVAASILDGLKN